MLFDPKCITMYYSLLCVVFYMAEKILELQNINIQFKEPILKDVNFSLAATETLAIVGESGSGKSITAQSIMQILPNGCL